MRRWGWLGTFGAAVLVMVATIPMDATAQQCPKGKLRIYTSWPMQGAMIPEGTGMKNGVDLAMSEAGGTVAGYCLEVINLDDASPQTGKWDGAVEAENANKAVADPLAGPTIPARPRSRSPSTTAPTWRRSRRPTPIRD